jgi:ABC-type lipoprotein release transport system permease subunit
MASVTGALVVLGAVALASLATARARQQILQIAVRRALGATGWDVLRLRLVESTLVTALGAVGGLALAPSLLSTVAALVPTNGPLVMAPALDTRAVLVVAAIAALVSFGSAVAGATRRATTPSVAGVQTTTRPVRRANATVSAVQTALAFVLTLGGALGAASLLRVSSVETGYEADRLALVEVIARGPDVRTIPVTYRDVAASLDALPGVTAGTFGGRIMRNAWNIATVRTEAGADPIQLEQVEAGGRLFEVFGLAPVSGRLPTAPERQRGDPVVVLSDRAAASLWPDGTALGRSIVVGTAAHVVIGVVPEPRFASLATASRRVGQIYTFQPARRTTTFVISADGPVRDALAAARRVIEASGDLDVMRAVTMREAFRDSLQDYRLRALVYGGFAASALLVVATAMFGLVAMTTSLRTREFGIRRALGAGHDRLVIMLLREQGVATLAGLFLGVGLAYWSLELLRGAAAGVTPTDYRLWGAAALTILATALGGALVPALRSTRVDPAVTLRAD